MHSAFSNKTKVFTGKRVIENTTPGRPLPMGGGASRSPAGPSQLAHPRPVGGGPLGFPKTPPAQRFHIPLRRVPTNTKSGTVNPPAPPSSRGQRARTGVWGGAGKARPSPQLGHEGSWREREAGRRRAPRPTAWGRYLRYHGLHHSLLTGG